MQCSVEDGGGRQVHRPREWRRRERRLAKETKKHSWHRSENIVKASAPLILDPIPGPMVEQMKTECSKFEKLHGIRVKVCLKAGQSVRTDAKSQPLKKTGCERNDCLPCHKGE